MILRPQSAYDERALQFFTVVAFFLPSVSVPLDGVFFLFFFYFFSVLSLFDFVNEFYGKTKDEIISGRRPTTKKEEKKKKAKRNG